MKKTILLLLIFVFQFSFSQEDFETYSNSYFKDKEFKIQIVKEKDETITFYIDANSMDATSKQVTLIVKDKNIENFKEILTKAKEKFVEWKKVAIENKVEKLSKNVDIKSNRYSAAFTYGKWKIDFNVKLNVRFFIVENKHLMILENASKLIASDNQYIDSKGFVFVFDDETEFDNFISKIDVQKAKEKLNKTEKKDDLFKN